MFYSETLPPPLTFDMSTYCSLVEETFETTMQPSFSSDKWSFNRKKNLTDACNMNKTELALLQEFAEASFQEACVGGLDTILQPMIHLREERNHRHHHRTGRSPPMIPSDSSSLPSPVQWLRWQPDVISQSSNNSGPSRPRAPLGSFHNPIVVEEDDSDNEARTPTNNTQCPRCHRYIHNSYHNEDYCNTIFVPGAPTMICHQCGLQEHVMLDCRETVCTWCERFGHFIENCPNLGWMFSNLGSSKLARVVLRFHPQHVRFHFYFYYLFLNNMPWTHVHLFLLSSMHNAHVTC